MPKPFFVSLKAIIQNEENKVLFLVKEKGDKKFLDLPGGRMEGEDTFSESIKRELKEELSFDGDIEVGRQVGETWELPSKFMKDGNRQLVIGFLVKTNLSDFSLSDEHIDHLWIGENDIEDVEKKGYVLLEGYRQNLISLFS